MICTVYTSHRRLWFQDNLSILQFLELSASKFTEITTKYDDEGHILITGIPDLYQNLDTGNPQVESI